MNMFFFFKEEKKLWSRCFLDTLEHLECEGNLQVFCSIYWAFLLLMCLLQEQPGERKEEILLEDRSLVIKTHTCGWG